MSIDIGRVYIDRVDGEARLSSRIKVRGRESVLYFSLDAKNESYLCSERSDAFIVALLPMAMRYGEDIVFETPASKRLCYLLDTYLIPTLSNADNWYKSIKLIGAVEERKLASLGKVGTGFSGGVDSLYTLYTHQRDSLYPVTHLAIFNMGIIEGENNSVIYKHQVGNAERFAKEYGYELVALDSNIAKVLPERFLDVYSFRNLAGALALQKLFSIYYLSSGNSYTQFELKTEDSAYYDLLTVASVQTESISIYNAGVEKLRSEKIKALSDWEPSYKWLHPCIYNSGGDRNCGKCFKCIRDMTTLYSLGKLDRYSAVFDTGKYYSMLPQRLGFVLAHDGTVFYRDAKKQLLESGAPIPPSAYTWEKLFRKSIKNVKESIDEDR